MEAGSIIMRYDGQEINKKLNPFQFWSVTFNCGQNKMNKLLYLIFYENVIKTIKRGQKKNTKPNFISQTNILKCQVGKCQYSGLLGLLNVNYLITSMISYLCFSLFVFCLNICCVCVGKSGFHLIVAEFFCNRVKCILI